MNPYRRGEVIEAVEAEPGVFAPGLQVYVSGEHLPENDTDRSASTGSERALVALPEGRDFWDLSRDEVLWFFSRWMRLDVADGQGSIETLKAYLGDARQHLEWVAGEGLTLAQVGEEEVKGYRAFLVERYAASTAGRKLVSVRRFYEMAQARGALPHNPAKGIASPKDKTARHERIKYLAAAEVQAVLRAPKRNTPKGIRDRAMLMLLAFHGLRVIELHRLDLADVDFEAGEDGSLRLLGKGDKVRTVLLVEETREALREWLAARNLARAADQAVFVALGGGAASAGERMSKRGIRYMVDAYFRACGVKRAGVSCHALRHSYATLSLNAGAPLLSISESMGHASVTTTQVYAKVLDKARNNPARFLVGVI